MDEQQRIYPNLSWSLFEIYNDNKSEAFEEMCKDLFICEYLKNMINPHADHNTPGVEVIPIQEPPRDDGKTQRFISFQAKYFSETVSDPQIIESLKKAVEHFSGRLDTIYLFCNKVISKETKKYKKYLDVLSPADIELELVTDKDIFTLLRKHARVADYFFQDRKRTISSARELIIPAAFASGVSDVEATESLDNSILQELLKDKLQKLKNCICDLKFGTLKTEIELLEKIKAEKTEKKIYFYRIILEAHEKKDFADKIILLPEEDKEEGYWLKSFSKNIHDLSIAEFNSLSIEMQVLALDLLFSAEHWDCIEALSHDRDKMSINVLKAFNFHYGLSLFNKGEYEQSHIILNNLFEQYHEYRFKLYDICALLQKANKEYVFGILDREIAVKKLLDELNKTKELAQDQIKANEPLIAVLEMQACFNLGAIEKAYIDQAIKRFNEYSDEAKTNDGVRLFAGLCFEMAGEEENAARLFSECKWQSEEAFAVRYLISLINLERYSEAVDVYKDLDSKIKTTRVEAIYLLLQYRLNVADYKYRLTNIVTSCAESLNDLFLIGYYVEERTIFDEIVFPRLETLLPKKLQQVDLQTRVGLLELLAKNKKLDSLGKTIDSISDIQAINRFITHEIYKCLFDLAKHESIKHDQAYIEDYQTIERIADKFINAKIQIQDFLQIRLLCASANHMVFSMLKYAKELFEYTHDAKIARSIVALLYERNEVKVNEYEPYLSALIESNDPETCVTVAYAMAKLGRYDEANYYIYKAIYELDGIDDFSVYKNIFGLINHTIFRIEERLARKNIASNMVVTLESNGEQWIVVLDSEEGFGDKDNRSLGVEHLERNDPVYVKLKGKGKNQVVRLRERTYKIINFEPREQYLSRFIFKKVQENPNEFKGTVWVISAENPHDMIQQVLSLADNKEKIREMVELYNSSVNDLGIPIDFLIHGNYGKYIDVQSYLLHEKDLAYYAGEPRLEYIMEAKYVPALSTLLLLASKDWLDTLDWLENKIVLPESYLPFFKEQYALAVGSQANSAGSLVPLDNGKFTIIKPDRKIPEIWEALINVCEKYPTERITDEERISYEVLDGYTWERIFSDTKIDKVQLDALILVERIKGIYYCDDLFFRKIAVNKGIKNINFATVLYDLNDLDIAMPIIMELSKTNYIYTPFRCRNNEEGQNLIQNLLEGEKKKIYYSQFFNSYFHIRNQIMHQYFGVEIPEKKELENKKAEEKFD